MTQDEFTHRKVLLHLREIRRRLEILSAIDEEMSVIGAGKWENLYAAELKWLDDYIDILRQRHDSASS